MSERPLPPNRRVAKPKVEKEVIEAPGEDAKAKDSPRDPWVSGRTVEALRTTAGVLFALGISIGCVWGLVRYTHTSPRFGIRHIEVTGTSHRTGEDVTRQGDIHSGDNVFALDLEAARARILEDPYIESVTLTRKLPGTLRIEVVEREASALVSMGGSLYLATREGEIFKKLEASDPFDLPVLTGIEPDRAASDREGVMARVRRALEVAAEYERVGPAKRHALQEIHIPEDGTTSLIVGKEGLVLRLGKGPYRQALEKASRVLGEVTARKAQASVIFLDNEAHPERVVVRMK